MWKVKQFLTRSIGKSIFKHSRSVCCLFCFSLSVIDSTAQSATNVDFFVVGSVYQMNGGDFIYDTIPTGCILFWSVKPEDADRAKIYRSESGHIAVSETIGSYDYLMIADSGGSPMPWFVNSGWRRSYKVKVEDGSYVTKYAVYPGIINKYAYDLIPLMYASGTGCNLLYLPSHPVVGTRHLLARSGNIAWQQTGYNYDYWRMYDAPVTGVAVDSSWDVSAERWEFGPIGFDNTSESMRLRWVFRDKNFMINLEAFRMHLPSKWWLKNMYTVGSGGIISINVPGGTGMGGYDETEGSGPVAPSEGGAGVGGSVPGDINNPPITPMGQNGKWVYDPEKKLWNWVGDFADNADQLNPWDNSVMPENQERGLAQEATLRQVKDGIEQIRMTLEEFQKQQGITDDQLQAMIDNAVVEIVDGQVQYWEGKHIPQAIASVGDQAAQSVGVAANQIENKLENVANRIISTVGWGGGIAQRIESAQNALSGKLDSLGSRVDSGAGAVNASIGEAKTDIVNAISDITMPENPTVEGQETESYEIIAPDLSSQIDGWFVFDFPQLTIARQFVFEDYDIGVFDWKIPFSAFNNSSLRVMINTVRNILAWLVYLSAGLGVFKAMGGGGV